MQISLNTLGSWLRTDASGFVLGFALGMKAGIGLFGFVDQRCLDCGKFYAAFRVDVMGGSLV